jgi:hypothetical protein
MDKRLFAGREIEKGKFLFQRVYVYNNFKRGISISKLGKNKV